MNTGMKAFLIALMWLSLRSPFASAGDQIIRPHVSVRAQGMGGVLYTTGLYEDNWYGNPARVADNPEWRIDIFGLMVETTSETIENLEDLFGEGDTFQQISETAGENIHARLQGRFLRFYIPNDSISLAVGFLQSLQSDNLLRNSFNTDLLTVYDQSFNLSAAKKFLDNRLGIGLSTRINYRLSSDGGFTLHDLIRGESASPLQNGGDDVFVDFDLGATYTFPNRWKDFEFTTALAMNNLAGSRLRLGAHLLGSEGTPLDQKRSLSLGVSATRSSVWKFEKLILGMEITDIGNGNNGSLFKHLHLGSEAAWRFLRFRAGIHQGYLTFGLGLALNVFTLDFASYGEELGQSVGSLQDRRLALQFAFHI